MHLSGHRLQPSNGKKHNRFVFRKQNNGIKRLLCFHSSIGYKYTIMRKSKLDNNWTLKGLVK